MSKKFIELSAIFLEMSKKFLEMSTNFLELARNCLEMSKKLLEILEYAQNVILVKLMLVNFFSLLVIKSSHGGYEGRH